MCGQINKNRCYESTHSVEFLKSDLDVQKSRLISLIMFMSVLGPLY